MGLTIQFQRRAIESHAREPEAISPPDITNITQIEAPDGTKFYYAGVSRGIGTCSDIHDMDVLVLTSNLIEPSRKVGNLSCAYTVLVRTLTPEEAYADDLARSGISRLCAELLEPVQVQDDSRVVFEPTGKNTFYTNVV